MFSLRKGKWKYIEGLGSGGFTIPQRYENENLTGQLYDLDQDPWEISNLFLKEPKKILELKFELESIKNK